MLCVLRIAFTVPIIWHSLARKLAFIVVMGNAIMSKAFVLLNPGTGTRKASVMQDDL
jgi:hypothetical protein